MWEPDTATSTKPSNKDSLGLESVCYTQCFCILQWNDGIPVFYHKEVSAEHCFCTTLRGVLCFTMHFQMEVRVINACACFFADLCVSQVFDILESFCTFNSRRSPSRRGLIFLHSNGRDMKHSLTKHATARLDEIRTGIVRFDSCW